MEEILKNIIKCKNNLEAMYDDIYNRTLRDYYALFISAMGYYSYITITPSFGAKLYLHVLNTSIEDPEEYLKKIETFLLDNYVDAVEKELTDEEKNADSK